MVKKINKHSALKPKHQKSKDSEYLAHVRSQPLQQAKVLLIFDEGPNHGWQGPFIGGQAVRVNVCAQEQLQPIQEFRSRGLFFQAWCIAQCVKSFECGLQDISAYRWEMDMHYFLHDLWVGKLDVVEKAAP